MHAKLAEPYFVRPPLSYKKAGKIWQVQKYLYGDKRAPRGWQDHMESILRKLDWERLKTEPSAFRHRTTDSWMIVHVDDMLCTGPGDFIAQFLLDLAKAVKRAEIVADGVPFMFLGDEVIVYADRVEMLSLIHI